MPPTVWETSRLIPTHAGKTVCRRGMVPNQRAHPHSRGENSPMIAMCAVLLGSSPLTRGKQRCVTPYINFPGLIPTHAGKTPHKRPRPLLQRAHPHSRGENGARFAQLWPRSGSSPLTRGKLRARERGVDRLGLIPTHAGKTNRRNSSEIPIWAHPHSRGENTATRPLRASMTGSSPLTRGKRAQAVCKVLTRGLIPTHAGKTLPDLRLYRADRSDLGKP